MKFRGILIACLLLTFLDVVSIDACGRKHYPDPNQYKGDFYVHFYYKVEEKYSFIGFYLLEAGYDDNDTVSIDLINKKLSNRINEDKSLKFKDYSIKDIYELTDFEINKENAVSVLDDDLMTITVTSDLVSGYVYGIRGAYHVAVLLNVTLYE